MNLEAEFVAQITGPITYEEIENRCVFLAAKHRLRDTKIDVRYMAKDTMAYAVCMYWRSGFLFKRQQSCSIVFGVTNEDQQVNILGREVDIDASIFYVPYRRWFRTYKTTVHVDFRQP